MIDAWFWPYLLRILLLTGVMVGLIYAVFFTLKYNKRFQQMAQSVSGGAVSGGAISGGPMSVPNDTASQGSPQSPFIQWCMQRFGLSAALPSIQLSSPNTDTQHSAVPVLQPTSVTDAQLASVAGADSAIQFSGPFALGHQQQVSVLTVDGKRHILVATPQGVSTLNALPAQEKSQHNCCGGGDCHG